MLPDWIVHSVTAKDTDLKVVERHPEGWVYAFHVIGLNLCDGQKFSWNIALPSILHHYRDRYDFTKAQMSQPVWALLTKFLPEDRLPKGGA